MMGGPVAEGNDRLRDLIPRELAVVTPLIALLLVLGVYPKVALDVINPAVSHTLTTIDQPDPAPKLAEGPATMNLPTPSVEYGLLSPMLIVFGAAIAGVLVEAFVRAQRRYVVQVVLSLVGLVARVRRGGAVGPWTARRRRSSGRLGAVAVDAPALFLQATILLVGVLGILLIAERRIPAEDESESESAVGGLDSFTPQASAVVGQCRREGGGPRRA